MKRILFVDDESRILDGLRRLLRPLRNEMSISFAAGGEAALAEIAAAPVDVVVSDMRMPGMDGATLLGQVMARCPRATRVVLSGQTEPERAVLSVSVAHQFLSKPCEPEHLQRILRTACEALDLADGSLHRESLSTLACLPVSEPALQALKELLAEAAPAVRDFACIARHDIALTAKLLQVANSAFFGVARPTLDVDHAATLMGTARLRELLPMFESSRPARLLAGDGRTQFEALSRHAQLASRIAARLLPADAVTAGAAGLLHDVGELAALAVEAMPAPADIPDADEASTGLGADAVPVHARLGQCLLLLWGLPRQAADIAGTHHAPRPTGRPRLDLATAVHAADVLASCADGAEAEARLVAAGHPEPDARGLASLAAAERAAFEQELEGLVAHVRC